MLSDPESDSDVESLHHLTINEHYAKAFEYKKEREELEKLKEKYGSDMEDDEDSETDSEEAESEDEDGEELTPAVDAAILRTLARIKRRDPEIYNAEKDIFQEEQKKTATMKVSTRAPKDKSKPVTMRQVALESALNPTSRSPSPQPLPHVEEQRALRSETIAAFHHAVDGAEDDDEDDLLVPREKTQDEVEREEEEYRAFLEREVGPDLAGLVTVDADAVMREDEDAEPLEDEPKKKKKSKKGQDKAKPEADQEFLMNYILNRGWIDRTANRVPTYGEITKSSKGKGKAGQDSSAADSDSEHPEGGAGVGPNGDDDLDEDDFEEIVDRFESSYNFRFEEPDGAVIQSYPRHLPSLVRREDTTRKEARERRKQRKEEELQKKKEEVKRLKALKMKEIRAKLDKIGREGGKNLDDEALQELDLEGDWDPDAHDRQMAGLYGNDEVLDDEKPQWDGDIDIGDIPMSDDEEPTKKKKKKKKKKGKEVEEEGVDIDAMDAEAQVAEDEEEWDGTEEMRKRKLDEYMDEVYGMDFNDMVGDMPTRFKYVPVQPQSFALTPAEILMATDAELNEYMSVKKYAPYRKTGWDSTRGDRLKELKQKVSERMPSGFGAGTSKAGADAVAEERPMKRRKGKKERMKIKGTAPEEGDIEKAKVIVGNAVTKGNSVKEANSGSKRKRTPIDEGSGGAQEDGETGKKKRRRHKKREAPE